MLHQVWNERKGVFQSTLIWLYLVSVLVVMETSAGSISGNQFGLMKKLLFVFLPEILLKMKWETDTNVRYLSISC